MAFYFDIFLKNSNYWNFLLFFGHDNKKGCPMNKISSAAGIVIVFLNNFILLDFYCYPILYENSGYSLPFYFVLAALLTIIIYLLTPKITFNPIKKVRQTKVLRIIMTLYLLIVATIGVCFASVALSSIFYEGRSFLPFLIMLVIGSLFFLNVKIPIIINTSFIFFIGTIFFLIFNTLRHINFMDFDTILLFKPNNMTIKGIIMMIFIVLDSYLYILIIPMLKHRGKKVIIIGTLLYFLMELVESSCLLMILGLSLNKFYGFGYFLYSIEPIAGIIGNFDFVYIYLITVSAIVKTVICLNMIKLFNFEKIKVVMPIVVSFLLIGGYFLSYYYYIIDDKLYIIIFGIIIIPIVFIIYLWRWYFENKRANRSS